MSDKSFNETRTNQIDLGPFPAKVLSMSSGEELLIIERMRAANALVDSLLKQVASGKMLDEYSAAAYQEALAYLRKQWCSVKPAPLGGDVEIPDGDFPGVTFFDTDGRHLNKLAANINDGGDPPTPDHELVLNPEGGTQAQPTTVCCRCGGRFSKQERHCPYCG